MTHRQPRRGRAGHIRRPKASRRRHSANGDGAAPAARAATWLSVPLSHRQDACATATQHSRWQGGGAASRHGVWPEQLAAQPAVHCVDDCIVCLISWGNKTRHTLKAACHAWGFLGRGEGGGGQEYGRTPTPMKVIFPRCLLHVQFKCQTICLLR